MLEILRELKEILKQKHQIKKDLRKLESWSLDYEALQRLVNNVSAQDVEFEITFENKSKMVIRKSTASANNFKSFSELYNGGK